MISNLTKEQRKQIHTIMNVDESLEDENAVLFKCLELVACMCDPDVLHSDAVFYVTTNDDGKITLEMDV